MIKVDTVEVRPAWEVHLSAVGAERRRTKADESSRDTQTMRKYV